MSANLSTLDRKRLGAFYTPDTLSKLLCDWAIRSPDDTVLEPSFGGCSFLVSSYDRLQELGSKTPAEKVYGFVSFPVNETVQS